MTKWIPGEAESLLETRLIAFARMAHRYGTKTRHRNRTFIRPILHIWNNHGQHRYT